MQFLIAYPKQILLILISKDSLLEQIQLKEGREIGVKRKILNILNMFSNIRALLSLLRRKFWVQTPQYFLCNMAPCLIASHNSLKSTVPFWPQPTAHTSQVHPHFQVFDYFYPFCPEEDSLVLPWKCSLFLALKITSSSFEWITLLSLSPVKLSHTTLFIIIRRLTSSLLSEFFPYHYLK